MTENITVMRELYKALLTLSYNSSIEMSDLYLERLTNLKWINIEEEQQLLLQFRVIVADLETEEEKIPNDHGSHRS